MIRAHAYHPWTDLFLARGCSVRPGHGFLCVDLVQVSRKVSVDGSGAFFTMFVPESGVCVAMHAERKHRFCIVISVAISSFDTTSLCDSSS
jgi:hypothetical protein